MASNEYSKYLREIANQVADFETAEYYRTLAKDKELEGANWRQRAKNWDNYYDRMGGMSGDSEAGEYREAATNARDIEKSIRAKTAELPKDVQDKILRDIAKNKLDHMTGDELIKRLDKR